MIQAPLWGLVAVAALLVLDRAGLWAESKGWIYWRRTKRRGSAMSAILSDLNAVTNPAATYVTDAKQAKKLEERDNGEPPSIVG
ncbi:MAG: hypothetical protein QM759_06750 [Terricaulis sp.]